MTSSLGHLRVVFLLLGGLGACATAPSTPAPAPAPAPASAAPHEFEEITVQRINVREPDGTLRLVISNGAKSPGPIVDPERGEEPDRVGGNGAGIVFYNEQGAENGALFHDGKDVGISIDRYQQDQTLQLTYGEDKTGYYAGMLVWDRPAHPHVETLKKVDAIRALPDEEARRAAMRKMQDAGEFGLFRMFVGRDAEGAALIEMNDRNQKPRLRLKVSKDGVAQIEFLDADGKVTRSFSADEPQANGASKRPGE